MSSALLAAILLCIDAHQGEWLPFKTLHDRVGCTAEKVRMACHELVRSCHVQHATRDGQDYYGIGVEGRLP